MVDIVLSMALSYQWSDVPNMVESILSGQTALMAMVDRKDAEKIKRLDELVVQVAASFDKLSKMHSSGASYDLPASLRIQLDEIRSDLLDYQTFVSDALTKSAVGLRSKFANRGQFFDSMIEKLLHSIKVLRFALTLAGYVLKQKSSTLSKLIVDPLACDQWTQRFGEDVQTSAEFKEVLDFLDSYFHNFGENCTEFENTCDNGSFFSYYRHDGAWCKCEKCISLLKEKLMIMTTHNSREEAVPLAAFAKFCGSNLLVSIRELIKAAHPSTSKYEIVSPYCKLQLQIHFDTNFFLYKVHIEAEVEAELATLRPAGVSKLQAHALKYNRIMFVGSSNLLADMHQWISRELCHSVSKIESVADLERFVLWVKEHKEELNEGKGKVLVVTTCQHVSCGAVESESVSVSKTALLARKVYEYLYMYKLQSVGFCMLTCPFVSHSAEQVEELNSMLKGFFTTMCLSSDARDLADYVKKMFALPNESSVADSEVEKIGNQLLTDGFDADFLDMFDSPEESSKTAPAVMMSNF